MVRTSKHMKMMAKLQRTPSWFKDEPEEEKVFCDICRKPIEKPDEPETIFGQPCHGTCKEDYIQNDDGPEYEPE